MDRIPSTTTPTLPGYTTTAVLGIVGAETIMGANVVRDVFARFTDFFGGRSGSYERKMAQARETAIAEMEAKARALGADAVVAVDIDYETLGTMLMVAATGTAVKLQRDPLKT